MLYAGEEHTTEELKREILRRKQEQKEPTLPSKFVVGGDYTADELRRGIAQRRGESPKQKPGALGLFGRGFKSELFLGYGADEPPPLETVWEKVAYGAGALGGMLPSFAAMSAVTTPVVGAALTAGRLGRLIKTLHTIGKVTKLAKTGRKVTKLGMAVEGAAKAGTLFAAHGGAHKLPPGEEGLGARLKAGARSAPMGMAFGASAPLVAGRLAHMGVAGAIGAGATAIQGGSTEDILIQGGLLTAMSGASHWYS